MIVNGKLDSVLFLIEEATRAQIKGVNVRKTLKAGRVLGLNENELGSVLKAIEMDHFVEWNAERKEWQVKQGTGLK